MTRRGRPSTSDGRAAPEGATRPDLDADVAICGYGPVGAVLANLLGRAGHRVAVFERAPSVYHLPRAAHFDHEIMRVFQSIGLADEVLACTTSLPGMHFLDAQGRVLLRFDRPAGPTADGWDGSYLFYQPDLERTLRRGVDRCPSVDVHLAHEVLALEVDAAGDAASLAVRDLATGADRTIHARWVVGCDGARSLVRRTMEVPVDDRGFDESWVVVDVALRRPVDLPVVCHQLCDPRRPTTYVPMPDPYRRWEFMLLDGEVPDDLERPERIRELLAPWLGPDDAEILRAVVYTFHAVVARGWRQGPVVLAGDAAHQMPPFLGQGMCSGIRDAASLAWRLDLLLRGVAGDHVLDTYEPERSPHVGAITDLAVTLGNVICTTDEAVAAERDRAMLADPSATPVAAAPPLSGGLLATGARGAGQRFPQPVVDAPAGRVRLDDLVGPRFAVIARTAHQARCGTTDPRWRRIGGVALALAADAVEATDATDAADLVVLVDDDGGLARWLDEHGCDAVLVRPDRYVFGAGDDVGALVDDLCAQLDVLPG